MDRPKEQELESRIAEVESALARLQASVAVLAGERRTTTSAHGSRDADANTRRARPNSAAVRGVRDDTFRALSDWFSSRTPEWWLSRLGIVFVVIAILFLYDYAIDRGWITPPVRVFAGILVGAVLYWLGKRSDAPTGTDRHEPGMRALLLGAALAVWYVTVYAAAVQYRLISIGSARLLFLVLALLSAWIALDERRAAFALIAVGAGFAAPFILAAGDVPRTPFAVYMAVMAAIGMFIYLVRGWPSTIWLTYVAFWLIVTETVTTTATATIASGSIALSVTIALAGAAFTRVASLRRDLVATGVERYAPPPVSEPARRITEALGELSRSVGGQPAAPDSLALWLMTILSPILAVSNVANLWRAVPSQAAGLVFVAIGATAVSLSMTAPRDRAELREVMLTGAALWTLLGIVQIAPHPEDLALSALFALAILLYARTMALGPTLIAQATAAIALVAIAVDELSFRPLGLTRWRWIISDVAAIAACAAISRRLITDARERMKGLVLGVGSYLVSLVVILNVLQAIWAPLVTVTYAILGAGLLILSRRRGRDRMLRQLGGLTMVIVVARLLLVDMSSVETIWRVLLFLVCGAVFLYVGYTLRSPRFAADDKSA